MGLWDRLKHSWNAFNDTNYQAFPNMANIGPGYTFRPDQTRFHPGVERSIITSVYNRIAIDCAAIKLQHVRVDGNGNYVDVIDSGLNYCLTQEANIDQTGRALIQDLVMSLCDEGCVAVVPVEASANPSLTGSYTIDQLRVGKVMQWYPQHVQVRLYDQRDGTKKDILVAKKFTAIIENPLYAVMNEPNSTLRRLIHKLNILDAIDEQSGAGKLDIIIQLPYTIKSEQKRAQAEARRKDIEMQLAGSKYGIAYADATEHITQLNRPAENNLMNQITYLTQMLYGQLGLTEEIFKGTADEATMLNYYNRTIEPILSAIADEMKRKFLTKTARSQGQSIAFFRDPFKLAPVEQIAEIADKFIRNTILTPNEMRTIVGYKPAEDEKANELRNPNLNQHDEETKVKETEVEEVNKLYESTPNLVKRMREESTSGPK